MKKKDEIQTRIERLAYLDGFYTLAKATELAKELEKDQDTKVFAVGTIFIATNGSYIYQMRNLADKDLLLEFVNNDVPIRHPEILDMAKGIAKGLKSDYGIDVSLVKAGEA